MALTKLGQDGPVPAQRTIRNRKYSLYASRIRPLTIESSMQEDISQVPNVPSLPVSPRWDSLSHGLHLLNQASPTPSVRQSPPGRLDISTAQAFPSLAGSVSPATIPSPRSMMSAPPDVRCESPSRSLRTKSSLADMRSPEASPAVENFSRPRKQSIRHTGLSEGSHSSPEPATAKPPLSAAIINLSDRLYDMSATSPQTPPWQRPRRPSASSVKSSCTPGSPLPLVHGDFAEARAPYRARNVTGPPALASARTQLGSSRAENIVSTPLTSPGIGGAAPWVSGDELRSSFRSQLTASTTPGTAVTERSSILTKASSVASLLDNADEPSLEDVMGMYEKGFADDEQDHDAEPDNDADSLGLSGSRPMTAVSEPEMRAAPVARNFPIMALATTEKLGLSEPTSRSALEAEIRQSRMIFTSPAFTSSVAAITGKAETDCTEKRDSAKSLDSEPSVASQSFVSDKKEKPTFAGVSVHPSRPSSPLPPPVAAPSPPPTVTSESEDPGSRDRYGFKKANQSISREQYDAWNKDYSCYLARRRRKWVAYLKDCALMTDRPIRFPSPCAKTKRFVRKGIPPDWRGAAWFYYAGGPAILAKHSGLYEKLLHKQAKQVDVEAIERDLHRTFPDNIQFKPSARSDPTVTTSERDSQSTMTRSSTDDGSTGPQPATPNEPPIITSLRRVLHAFSIYNPRIGYCQSLNFLAGLLLLFVETEEQCFWLLNVITIIYLPGTHDMSLEGSRVDLGVLMTELHDSMPSVWEKIGGELESLPTGRPSTGKSVRKTRPMLRRREPPGLSTDRLPPITLCMTAWFMSCYIGTLPIETTLRVWDVFFYEGSKTLFRIALAIFKSGESEIKAVNDPMEMFGVVQAIPRRILDANALMEGTFKRRNGFGHLSQGAIDERRQERRDQARLELEQKVQGEKAGLNGNLTEAETGTVPRRGTLFGKKKKHTASKRAPEA
ncbi:Rab-GAP/TBC domain protein [Moelleriella libera RCEF 2490]|uniref:Rab-GAP/TBC domain protein n=1 Tax=Moelleriella libera RCEF 2490 TaxID=1081109 RepID=A0A168EJR9_9HYPO|nr:Rab-GAP/TBC domain protein [Moelleriella libera RCEF 2490]